MGICPNQAIPGWQCELDGAAQATWSRPWTQPQRSRVVRRRLLQTEVGLVSSKADRHEGASRAWPNMWDLGSGADFGSHPALLTPCISLLVSEMEWLKQ